MWKLSLLPYDKYRYSALDAQHDYQMTLTSSRQGVNATVNDIKQLGELLLPLLKKGQSIYSILQSHRRNQVIRKRRYTTISKMVSSKMWAYRSAPSI